MCALFIRVYFLAIVVIVFVYFFSAFKGPLQLCEKIVRFRSRVILLFSEMRRFYQILRIEDLLSFLNGFEKFEIFIF